VPERSSILNAPRRFAARVHRGWMVALERSTWQSWALIAIAIVAAVAVRRYLAPDPGPNYIDFIGPWFQYLDTHGFSGLGQEFANYNVPYLYVLYLGTLLPGNPVIIVKAIAVLFDLSLVAGVGAIVWRLRGSAMIAAAASACALLIPEIFLDSALQGQADSTYTSFLVWAAYFMIRRRDIAVWVMFGLAFSFKLQALFLLPWILIALIVQRHRIRAILIGVAVFFATWIPALIAGRNLGSLAGIYLDQTVKSRLTEQAANLWQWVPNSLYDYVRPAGLAFGLGVVAILALVYLRRSRGIDPPEIWLLQVGAAFAAIVPFVLPQMHDRFFFAASVFTFLCATLMPRYLIPLIGLQFTAVMANSVALLSVPPPIPLAFVAVVQLVLVFSLVALPLLRPRTRPEPILPALAVVGDVSTGSETG
jgi:Gpi18-like mannosyltransferase